MPSVLGWTGSSIPSSEPSPRLSKSRSEPSRLRDRGQPMTQRRWFDRLAGVAVIGLAACGDLEVANPNAPIRETAFSDPATIVSVAAGTMKTWVNTRWAYDPALTLSAMSDSYTASWNNFNMRYYSSYGVD